MHISSLGEPYNCTTALITNSLHSHGRMYALHPNVIYSHYAVCTPHHRVNIILKNNDPSQYSSATSPAPTDLNSLDEPQGQKNMLPPGEERTLLISSLAFVIDALAGRIL
jgi:hypothetical protein